MKMPQLVYAALATATLASASFPALSWTAWPDVDFEWYANVGKPLTTVVITPVAVYPLYPAPRDGMIWSPTHWETRGDHQVQVRGHWIRERVGYHWMADRWDPDGDRYHYVPGHWER